MTYRADIERALANAMPLAPNRLPFDQSFLAEYADAPDAEPVVLPKDFVDHPHHAYASTTPGDFEELVDELADMGFDLSKLQDKLTHEQAHWEAAQRLGATAGRFGVLFNYEEVGGQTRYYSRLFLETPGWDVSKLGLAIVKAFPDIPSDGDEADYRALGYTDRNHVAERARLANRHGLLRFIPGRKGPYPVPPPTPSAPRRRGRFIRALPGQA